MFAPHHTTRYLLALALAVSPLSACSSSRGDASASSRAEPRPTGVLLSVENRNVLDARLYLVRGSVRIHVGTLGSNERRTFPLPAVYLGSGGELVLETELLASRERHQTDPIPVVLGDRLEWVIGHRLALSHVAVVR